jgi:hypothetical protein
VKQFISKQALMTPAADSIKKPSLRAVGAAIQHGEFTQVSFDNTILDCRATLAMTVFQTY